MAYQRPSHRDTDGEQPEVCMLCGNVIEHARLRVAEVEGLQGVRMCDLHPFEAATVFYPSRNDYLRMEQLPDAPEAGQRLWPIGADFNDLGWVDTDIP